MIVGFDIVDIICSLYKENCDEIGFFFCNTYTIENLNVFPLFLLNSDEWNVNFFRNLSVIYVAWSRVLTDTFSRLLTDYF